MAGFEMKRFWKKAEVTSCAQGYSVELDGRPLKTPLKRPLYVPSHALATEIAAEWRNVEGKVDVKTMPYTQFCHAALDQAIDERIEIIAKIASYGETDLLCYRAESPQELVARQQQAWDPVLHWSDEALGAPLRTTTGIIHIEQPADSLASLGAAVSGFDGFALKALYDWVTLSGSLVLGLAVARGQLGAAEAWALSRVDEQWQEDQWGVDDEALQLAESRRATFLVVERALALI
ncbi:MAG: ATPase [Rhodobacteraceae bacterium]|nr:ATPase [Paracoccaceae bacterium]